jgi:putative tryptophan/tyrosine transport system substrate-binding protein
MRRREFITLLGGAAAASPLASRAQQPAMPVIGFLGSESPNRWADRLGAFRQGLSETGFVESSNVAIEYRWAEGHNDRFPALAADLIRRQVTVIAVGGLPGSLAAKAATATIPIVFQIGVDPVAARLVDSLSRPGGNITGACNLSVELGPKRLELVHEVLPAVDSVAVLVDPTSGLVAQTESTSMQAAAQTLGLKLHVLGASVERDLDTVFATLNQLKAGAIVIANNGFFNARAEQLGALTLRNAIPAVFQSHGFTAAGGLISYGTSVPDGFRLIGVYAGRILKGEKPAELPVQQSTKVEMIINLKTAKALGINVPLPLLGRADEVIE